MRVSGFWKNQRKRFIFVYKGILYLIVVGHVTARAISNLEKQNIKVPAMFQINSNHPPPFIQSRVINSCSTWIQFFISSGNVYPVVWTKVITNLYLQSFPWISLKMKHFWRNTLFFFFYEFNFFFFIAFFSNFILFLNFT